MRSPNWQIFASLSGGASRNWEVLCRELVRRHYGRYGRLYTRRQQPGIEFHLHLDKQSDLGEPGRHYGWQCRWYDGNKRLTTTQRRGILNALQVTRAHVLGLTDWVLWTREVLTKPDADWFHELDVPYTLHAWDEQTVEALLTGPGEALAQTWFGAAVLDADRLRVARAEALAPISHRYIPELHVSTELEQNLVLSLALTPLAEQLSLAAQETRSYGEVVTALARSHPIRAIGLLAAALGDALSRAADATETLSAFVAAGDLRAARQERTPNAEVLLDPVDYTNALAFLRSSSDRDADVIAAAERRLAQSKLRWASAIHEIRRTAIAVIGSAGRGKTHFAARLTGADNPGVLLLGRDFAASLEADQIARATGLTTNLESLLEALQTIGEREQRRVPIVIDGLNESEPGAPWATVLPRVASRLERFPHVLLIVTTRPAYEPSIPSTGFDRLELTGFGDQLDLAVKRYVAHYSVNAMIDDLPLERFEQPLFLRLFIEAMGRSQAADPKAWSAMALTHVLDAYLDGACDEVSVRLDLAPERPRELLLAVAHDMWRRSVRTAPWERVRELAGDEGRPWSASLARALESEEILLRDTREGADEVAFAFDLLAGHVLATAVLPAGTENLLGDDAWRDQLRDHPLFEDVVTGVAGLLAARGEQPMWRLVEDDDDLRIAALLQLPRLPPGKVDDASLSALGRLISQAPGELFSCMLTSMFMSDHPCNAAWLDRVLSGLPMCERDQVWGRWLRDHHAVVREQLSRWHSRWADGSCSEARDRLAATWSSWVLVTTVPDVRNDATNALYQLGRQEPDLISELAARVLEVNDDVWVLERVITAAYGIAQAAQADSRLRPWCVRYAAWLEQTFVAGRVPEVALNWLVRRIVCETRALCLWLVDENPRTTVNDLAFPPDWTLPQLSTNRPERREVVGTPVSVFEEIVRHLPSDACETAGTSGNYVDALYGHIWRAGWRASRFYPLERMAERARNADTKHPLVTWGAKYAHQATMTIAAHAERGNPQDEALDENHMLRDFAFDRGFTGLIPRIASDNEFFILDSDRAVTDGETSRLAATRTLSRLEQVVETSGDWLLTAAIINHRRHPEMRIMAVALRHGWADAHSVSDVADRLIVTRPAGEPKSYSVTSLAYSHCRPDELLWSARFGRRLAALDPQRRHSVGPAGAAQIGELCAHWIRLAPAGPPDATLAQYGHDVPVPAPALCIGAGLSRDAEALRFVDAAGRPAALLMRPPGEWIGWLLYVRADVATMYAENLGCSWWWLCTSLDGVSLVELQPAGGA
jgi:hypothetical protein